MRTSMVHKMLNGSTRPLATVANAVNFLKMTRTATITARVAVASSGRRFASTVQPFHHAFPVADLDKSRSFYGGVLGCTEGRSSHTWIDYELYGHQIVCHWVGKDYKHKDYFNDVDKDAVPVPHFGVCLTVEQFKELASRIQKSGIKFIVEPHLRFEGKAGEQWTMFFKDPAGNNLEFKAMTNPANLFAKYFVDEGKHAAQKAGT